MPQPEPWEPELYEAAGIDHPTAARLRNAAIVGVEGNAAQHQVAWLEVPVDDDALAVRRPSTCHSLIASRHEGLPGRSVHGKTRCGWRCPCNLSQGNRLYSFK